MKKLLITDTHFGTRQNSITWLNKQMDFMYNQIIPYIENSNEPIHLIHLGDVFDSRSTISTLVASKVYDLFKKLSNICSKITIICGNHDYYSPNSDQINSVSLILKDLNINIVSNDIFVDGEDLFIPWFEWFKTEKIKNTIQELKIKNIFTHADIVTEEVGIKNINIFSGHMHTPKIDANKQLFNLGSSYSLDFGDSNSSRGYYILENGKLDWVVNDQSINFYRFYNGDILNPLNIKRIKPYDYVEIYINSSQLSDQIYCDAIKSINDICKNVWTIPQVVCNIDESETINMSNYDIDSIIENYLPENLKSKFIKIKKYEE